MRSLLFFVKKIGTQLPGTFQSLLHLPFLNQPRIAAEQDIRDFPTVELRRTGVNRCGEQSVLETVAQCRSFIREGTGDESDDGIRKDGGWQFATAEDVVADGNFPCD